MIISLYSNYKPGAEILGVTFGLSAEYSDLKVDRLDAGQREVTITCKILNAAGRVLAECYGSCSTFESKYRWREAQTVAERKAQGVKKEYPFFCSHETSSLEESGIIE